MKKLTILITFIVTSIASCLVAANDFADVKITVTPVSGDVYMLQGAGGNIGLLATQKGLILVDDQFEPLAEKIELAMAKINQKPLKYVINTHYHGDHTGSNSYFSHKAPIFSHENVRSRLKNNPKLNADALPVVTYNDGLTIHLDNEEVKLMHLPKGHTDGDTVVYFKKANVIHAGDLFFESRFPYVDLKAGGTVQGYLNNIKTILKTFPDDVKIIPGHGRLTNKSAYQALADMMKFSIDKVKAMKAKGMSDDAIVKAGLGEKYKSWSWSFITEEKWINTILSDTSLSF